MSCCNKCNNSFQDCGCKKQKVTTTTTTIPIPPCDIDNCEEIILSECIIYNSSVECISIDRGDNLNTVFEKILASIKGYNCSCDFCAAVVEKVRQPVTTTTSTTTLAPTTTSTSSSTTTSTSSTTSTTTISCEFGPIAATELCFEQACLITAGEAQNSVNSFLQIPSTLIGMVNGQGVYEFVLNFNLNTYTIILFWTGSRWEFRFDDVNGGLIAYLNIPYLPGDPVPYPDNFNDYWFPTVTDFFPLWLISDGVQFVNQFFGLLNIDSCCTCFEIFYTSVSTGQLLPGSYSGTYENCSSEISEWVLTPEDTPVVQFCTSNVMTITYSQSPSFITNFRLGGQCQIDENNQGICSPICVTFMGGQGNNIFDEYTVLAYPSLINGKKVYTLQGPDGNTLYIVTYTNPFSFVTKWHMVSDLNDIPNTTYAILEVNQAPYAPIGFYWVCENQACATQGLGIVYTKLNCESPDPKCACWSFALQDGVEPSEFEITYTNCDGNLVTELISVFSTEFGPDRCVQLGSLPLVPPELKSKLIWFCEEYRFPNSGIINCNNDGPVP